MEDRLKIMVYDGIKRPYVNSIEKKLLLEKIINSNINYFKDRSDLIILKEKQNDYTSDADYIIIAAYHLVEPASLSEEQIQYIESEFY